MRCCHVNPLVDRLPRDQPPSDAVGRQGRDKIQASANRTLDVRGAAIPEHLGRPILEPVRLSGREGVNSLFEYELYLKTPEDLFPNGAIHTDAVDFDLDAFIGREISCSIELDGTGFFVPGAAGDRGRGRIGAGVREINGLIAGADFWGEEGRHLQYRLVIRPWLHLATLSTDCKVFQNKTVVEILDELLADYIFPVDKRLFDRYPRRDYQTQYNESDFEFFERLCQEWGINYHFEHSEGKHRLILSDAMVAFRENDSEAYRRIQYHAPGWKADAEYIHSFVPTHRLTSGRYATRDYDYTRARDDMDQLRHDPRPTGQADGEVYQWRDARAGSHYAQPRAGSNEPIDPQPEGRQIALLRMQALRNKGARAKASGNLRGMSAGSTFRLVEHPRKKANAEYLILDTRFTIEVVGQNSQVGQLDQQVDNRGQRWRVDVDLTAHPVGEQLRPDFTRAKPHTYGPHPALVVGPADQNIWTDEYGRIKIQFPWDRLGRKNQHSSCWVRVSSPWAGNQLGSIQLPRIGQEVVIDFEGGDPDLPICTGRVHNQMNLPPWSLPGQSALSGFRSRELTDNGGGNGAAGRSNHLVLDDTAQKLQLQVKSDHQHSQLSLGHIHRIEDHDGRKDSRGEGLELRTDGAGAVRAGKGLLLSTDGRANAVGGILSRDELVNCLQQALSIARGLGEAAAQCDGVPRETEPQQALSDAVHSLGHGAGDETKATGKAEAGQPIVAISGAAGIATATPQDHTQYAGQNIDTVAGRNQQHYAERSILHSAGQGIEQFAHRGDIRSISSEGKVITQAQHGSVEITAQKGLVLTSTEDGAVLRAKKAVTLVLEDGTYLRLAGGKIELGMKGQFTVKSAGRQFVGPASLPTEMPEFYVVDQARQMKLHRNEGKPEGMSDWDFEVIKGSGDTSTDRSGADAINKLEKGGALDIGG